jgi:hypothetical protein
MTPEEALDTARRALSSWQLDDWVTDPARARQAFRAGAAGGGGGGRQWKTVSNGIEVEWWETGTRDVLTWRELDALIAAHAAARPDVVAELHQVRAWSHDLNVHGLHVQPPWVPYIAETPEYHAHVALFWKYIGGPRTAISARLYGPLRDAEDAFWAPLPQHAPPPAPAPPPARATVPAAGQLALLLEV